jgi:hypothetical protein
VGLHTRRTRERQHALALAQAVAEIAHKTGAIGKRQDAKALALHECVFQRVNREQTNGGGGAVYKQSVKGNALLHYSVLCKREV